MGWNYALQVGILRISSSLSLSLTLSDFAMGWNYALQVRISLFFPLSLSLSLSFPLSFSLFPSHSLSLTLSSLSLYFLGDEHTFPRDCSCILNPPVLEPDHLSLSHSLSLSIPLTLPAPLSLSLSLSLSLLVPP
jgi:hypothetical protein